MEHRPIGHTPTPESSAQRLYRQMWADPHLRARILDIRDMDRRDGRVKKIHLRSSRAAAKGGLRLAAPGAPKWLQAEFRSWLKNLRLDHRDKLESDLRGLMMEGNLALEYVLNADQSAVVGCARLPSETLVPLVGPDGQFLDPGHAYEQRDPYSGKTLASFGLWQLTLTRLTPDNYDDFGSMGRPYLDATREVWKQLRMTEEDLVVRRRMRAPLRMHHVLENASEAELQEYRNKVEEDQASGATRDYYTNKKGSVNPVQGDANLDQIADVSYLLDNFFGGAPAPKGLFGYAGDLQRDILEDLKKDFYDELDALQDNAAYNYEQGFRLHLLLRGRNPDAWDLSVQFAERLTDTANQRADRALKLQALGLPRDLVWETAGVDVVAAKRALERQREENDPYPLNDGDTPPLPGERPRPRVTVTPGNRRKGESATDIATSATS